MRRIVALFVALPLASTALASDSKDSGRPDLVGVQPSLGGNMAPIPAVSRVPQDLLWVERTKYRGASYRLDPDVRATDISPRVRDGIQRVLREKDFIPLDRLSYFSWCDQPGLAVVGWSGYVEEISATPLGWVAKVRISPKLERISAVGTMTNDYQIEEYFFGKDGRVEYLGRRPGPGAMRGSLFDF